MESENCIESRRFRMGTANFVSHLIFTYAGPWLLALCGTAVVGVALGIAVDLRWFIVGLMIVFIIIPMLMAFMYYYHGLRRECLVNSVDHTLIVEDGGITVRMFFPSVDNTAEDGGDAGLNEEERVVHFDYKDMKPFGIGVKSIAISFRKPLKGFLWMPFDAFGSPEETERVLGILDSRIHKEDV